MTHAIGQDLSYHYLVDPTPEDEFTESDYLHPANAETIYRVTEYPYGEIEKDLKEVFPDGLSHEWAERYFEWWMDEKKDSVIDDDPNFYLPIDANQWEGDWDVGRDYKISSVTLIFGRHRQKLTRTEFSKEVNANGFYQLGSLSVSSWDEVLEIVATYPRPSNKVQFGTYAVITEEKLRLYQEQLEKKEPVDLSPPSGFLHGAELPESEIYFLFQADRPARVPLPFGDGSFELEYEKLGTIRAHIDFSSSSLQVENGSTLVSFEGVYLTLSPEEVVDLLKGTFRFTDSELWDPIFFDVAAQLKSYYRVAVQGVVVMGGRPYLALDFSVNPILRHFVPSPVFVEMSLPVDSDDVDSRGIAESVLGDPSFRLQSDFNSALLIQAAADMMSHAQTGQGGSSFVSQLLPPSYSGSVWIRSLEGHYILPTPHPLLGEEADVIDGRVRIDFDSLGNTQIEGNLPLLFLRDPEDPLGPQSSASIDFRVKTDDSESYRGWSEAKSHELPNVMAGLFEGASVNFFFSDVVLDRNATEISQLVTKMISLFELELIQNDRKLLLIQGGSIFTQQDSQFYVASEGDVLDEKDVALSINGTSGDPLKHFEISGLSFELVDGFQFEVTDIFGSYEKSPEEVVVHVQANFNFKAEGLFTAEKRVIYNGEILINLQTQTVSLKDISIPLPDMMMSLSQGDELLPFLFSGRLDGPLTFDLKKEEIIGPFVLTGDLTYLKDGSESGIPLFPSWVEIVNPFSAHTSFNGVVYRPGDASRMREVAMLIEGGEKTNTVESIKGITFQVNKLWRERSSGEIYADLLIDARSVSLAYNEVQNGESPVLMEEEKPVDDTEAEITDHRKEWVVRSEPVGLDDWDLHLEDYGLDRERATMMLEMMRNAKEAHFVIDGLELNVPPSRLLWMGPAPIYVPKDSVPIVDVRIVDGNVESFHLYFTKPLGFPPLIRGLYFDKAEGKFRIDFMNKGDAKRPVESYRVSSSEPTINQALFKMLPLPEETRLKLLAQSDLNPHFLQDDGTRWLTFLFLSLVAIEKQKFRSAQTTKKKRSRIHSEGTVINISSIQLKPGTHLQMAGVHYEFNCPHDTEDPNHDCAENNVISGSISVSEGTARFSMDKVAQLRMWVPTKNGDSSVLNLDLREGAIREIILGQEEGASVMTIRGMMFDKSTFRGSAFEENLDLRVISNLRVNEMELRKESGINDLITLTADFDVDLEEGDLHYREGKREAHFEMDRSQIHVQTSIQFEEIVRVDPDEERDLFNPLSTRSRPITETVLKGGEFVITSDELSYKRVSFTPGIEFGPSKTRDARIVLRTEEGDEYLHHEGNLDWNLSRPFRVPLAQVRLIPGLSPDVNFTSMRVSGDGFFTFKDGKLSFGELNGEAYEPFLVTYEGGASLAHVANPARPEGTTEMSTAFSGSSELRQGVFFLEEEREGFPLHIEEILISNVHVDLHELNGTVYRESPSPKGLSAFSFRDGTGFFAMDEVHLMEGRRTELTGLEVEMLDSSERGNSIHVEGDLEVLPDRMRFDRIKFNGTLYDEINETELEGIEFETHPQL